MVAIPAPLLFPFRPAAALHPDRGRIRWIPVCLFLLAAGTLLFWLEQRSLLERMLLHLPPSADGADRTAAAAWSMADFPRRCSFHPLRLLFGYMLFALILRLAVLLVQPPRIPGYRAVVALDLHAELVLVVGGFMNLVSGGGVPDASDLFPHAAPAIRLLLAGCSPFGVWYLGILAAGLVVVTGLSRIRAVGAVLLACSITAVANAGVLVTVIERFHLLL